MVGVESGSYCFFVTHNVVLTPEQIAELSDEELCGEIIAQSGLYMKETNCTSDSHKALTAESWAKDNGSLFLSEADIEALRSAGIETFVYTNQSTAVMENLHAFAAEGCTMEGLCTITRQETRWGDEEPVEVMGIRFSLA